MSQRYSGLTKANLLFYRLPNWSIPIAVYGLLSLVTALLLLRNSQSPRRWIAFGLTQFLAAMLLLTIDWLVVFAAGAWILRTWHGKAINTDRLALLSLAIVGALSLVSGWLLSSWAQAGGFSAAIPLARGFERGGAFSYGIIAIFAAVAFWELLKQDDSGGNALLVATGIAVFVLGLHQQAYIPVLDAIPYSVDLRKWGQWLPLDPWTYFGIFILLAWPSFRQLGKSLRFGCAGMLIFMAISRLLAAPADDVVAIIVGFVCFTGHAACSLWADLKLKIVWVGAIVLLMVFIVPFNHQSFLEGILRNTPRVFLRDWSRQDTQSAYFPQFKVGAWIRGNTPEGSLIIGDETYLRYWMRRPMIIGDEDSIFVSYNAQQYAALEAEFNQLQVAFSSPEALLEYSRAHDADYIVVKRDQVDMSTVSEVTPIYVDDYFIVYSIDG
jgi:hypothetical protein